jgi:hypothetical protein
VRRPHVDRHRLRGEGIGGRVVFLYLVHDGLYSLGEATAPGQSPCARGAPRNPRASESCADRDAR